MSFAFAILGIGIGMAAWSFVFEFLYKQIKKKRQQQVGGVSGDHRINVTNSINSKTNNQDKSAAAPVIGGNAMERGQVNKVNDSIKKTKNEESKDKDILNKLFHEKLKFINNQKLLTWIGNLLELNLDKIKKVN